MRPVWTFSEFSLQSYSRFRERSFFQRCGKGEQMRCRLILLISEHPIQQGIRKGGVRIFGHGRGEDGRGRGRTDRMAYSRQLDAWVCISLSWEPLDPRVRLNCTARPSLHMTALKINKNRCIWITIISKACTKTLPEAQRTQGIDFLTWVTSTARNLATRWCHLN